MKTQVETTLADLAERINEQHRACEQTMNAGLHHALECGRLLLEAKKQVGHGAWLPWLAENCKFSKRTAQAYMRVSSQYPRLNGKAQRVALLTFRGAVAALASNSTTLANVPEEVQAKALGLWEEKGCKNSHQAIHQAEMAIRWRASEEEVAAKQPSRARSPVAEAVAGPEEERPRTVDELLQEHLPQFVQCVGDLRSQLGEVAGDIPADHRIAPLLEAFDDALQALAFKPLEWAVGGNHRGVKVDSELVTAGE